MTTQRCVVIFDLDGTLTRRESYLAYLAGFLIRHPRRLLHILPLPWAVLKYALRRINNTELKQHFLHAVLGGAPQHEVEQWSRIFVDRLLAGGLRCGALQTLESHRRSGDLLVLLTASFDFYVNEVGRRLGFHHVLCTQAEWVDGYLSGKLAGPNHRGEEKVRCLQRLKDAHIGSTIAAYADHSSDLTFLALVDQATLVNGSFKARRLAKRQGIRCAIWKT
jgi:phosphatidylglycerophosphatase C